MKKKDHDLVFELESVLKEWTNGLTSEESRIEIFNRVRDIPYFVDLEMLGLEKGPEKMLKCNGGSCTPKHYLLGMMYERIGIPVKYCTYSFWWHKQDVDYTEDVLKAAKKLPATYHLACEAMIEGSWVLVDATWDPPLRAANFPVNERWDGKSDTLLAITPEEKNICTTLKERDEDYKARISPYTSGDKLQLSRFSKKLNKWLEEVRQKEAK